MHMLHFASDPPAEITEQALVHLDEEAVVDLLRLAIHFNFPRAVAKITDFQERARSGAHLEIFDKLDNLAGAIGADMNIRAAKNSSIFGFIDAFKNSKLPTLAYFTKAELSREQQKALADAKVQHISLHKLASLLNRDPKLAAKALCTHFSGAWTLPSCPSCKEKMRFDGIHNHFACATPRGNPDCRNLRVHRPPMLYKSSLGKFLDESNSLKLYASLGADADRTAAPRDIPGDVYERHFALYKSRPAGAPNDTSKTSVLLPLLALACVFFFYTRAHEIATVPPQQTLASARTPAPDEIRGVSQSAAHRASFGDFTGRPNAPHEPMLDPAIPQRPELPTAPKTERMPAQSARSSGPVSAFVCHTIDNRFYATAGRCGADAKYAYPFTIPSGHDIESAAQAEVDRKAAAYSGQRIAAEQLQSQQQIAAYQLETLRGACQRAYAEYRELSNRLNRSNMTIADFQYYKTQSERVRKQIDTQCIPNQIFEQTP